MDSLSGNISTALCCLDREHNTRYMLQLAATDGGGLQGMLYGNKYSFIKIQETVQSNIIKVNFSANVLMTIKFKCMHIYNNIINSIRKGQGNNTHVCQTLISHFIFIQVKKIMVWCSRYKL